MAECFARSSPGWRWIPALGSEAVESVGVRRTRSFQARGEQRLWDGARAQSSDSCWYWTSNE